MASTSFPSTLLKQSLRIATRPRSCSTTPARFLTTSTTSSTPSSSSSLSGTKLYYPSTTSIQSHLRAISPEWDLEEMVAVRAMTHKSASTLGGGQNRSIGHGEKLSFLGRRILRMHLSLHLSNILTPIQQNQALSAKNLDLILSTHALGAGPGRILELEKAMRWREVRGPDGLPTGLYKSRGAAMEALVGAVYTQHGIEATSKMFNNLLLPHLELPQVVKQSQSQIESS